MTSSFKIKNTGEESSEFLAFFALNAFGPDTQHAQAYLSPTFLTRFHKLKYDMLMSPLWQREFGLPVAGALKYEREKIKKFVIVGTGALADLLQKDGWVGGERWMQQLAMFFAIGDLIQSAKLRPASVLRIMFYDTTFGVYDVRILSALGAEVFMLANSLHGPGNLNPYGFQSDTFIFDLATQGAEGVKRWDTDLRGAVRIGHGIRDSGKIGRLEIDFCLEEFPVCDQQGEIFWHDEANVLKEMIFPSPEPLRISWPFYTEAGSVV